MLIIYAYIHIIEINKSKVMKFLLILLKLINKLYKLKLISKYNV
jgi:hypothetical protein